MSQTTKHPETLPVTVSELDVHAARHSEAYCPLASALARTYPALFSPWNIGTVVAPLLTDETEEHYYLIPEEAWRVIINPWDTGMFDPDVLPYTCSLTWATPESWDRLRGGKS